MCVCVSEMDNYDHLPNQESLLVPQIPGSGHILLICQKFLHMGKEGKRRKEGEEGHKINSQ